MAGERITMVKAFFNIALLELSDSSLIGKKIN